MDLKSLIDFTKYTLAVAAASFVYTLEKFVPMPTATGRQIVLGALLTFLASAFMGILLFAVSTAALHLEEDARRSTEKRIEYLGKAHAVLLFVGLLVLGGLLLPRVMGASPASAEPPCCCRETPRG